MLTRADKKLQKAEDDGLEATEIERLAQLLTAARERMVCLRAAKRKHKFVPCWPACENLIEDLKERGMKIITSSLICLCFIICSFLTREEQLYDDVFVVCFFCFRVCVLVLVLKSSEPAVVERLLPLPLALTRKLLHQPQKRIISNDLVLSQETSISTL